MDWESAAASPRASPGRPPPARRHRTRTTPIFRPRHTSTSSPPARGSPRACASTRRSPSLVETPPLGLGELRRRGLLGREVAGGLLGIHLDLGVSGYEIVGDRHLLDDLDALLPQRIGLHVAHGG